MNAAPTGSVASMLKSPIKGALQALAPEGRLVWHRRGRRRPVALTFDDGPDPEGTPRMLDELRGLGVRATFFLLGRHVRESPGIVRRIREEGHELGNHSFSHPRTDLMRDSKSLRAEIEDCNRAIEEAAGVRPRLFRPPYGGLSIRLLRCCWSMDLSTILWSLDTRDFSDQPVPPGALANAVRPGDIILMHEAHASAREIVQGCVPALHGRGIAFATVSELLAA